MKKNSFFLTFLFFYFSTFLISFEKVNSLLLVPSGNELFEQNCSVCHLGGNNIIIPEKNLKKDSLEENGMNNINSISYQILNGKNGMPAFAGRLTETEIEAIAKYVLEKSKINFGN